jgi:AcrR family transcriptional regulator
LLSKYNGVTLWGMAEERLPPVARVRLRHQETLQRAILDTASRLLAEEGPQALTMRRVAAAAGCSTTVLYTAFGGKDGLADALYREGFERLGHRLAAAASAVDDPEDPLAVARALATAYRAAALEDHNYYGVMFGQVIPGFVPSAESLAVGNAALAALADAVREGMTAGFLVPGDPIAVAEVLWAAAHGVVSLELAGHFPDPETAAERYRTLTRAALAAFMVNEPEEEHADNDADTKECGDG